MAMNYPDYSNNNPTQRQRDLVLAINEYCYLQSKTDGSIKSYVGPMTMTIGAQESLVIFNAKTKRFEETSDFEVARQLFTSAPEGWYAIMKNPTEDGLHPEAGKPNNSPKNMKIGTKVNIPGPVTFALFPGQMTKVVRGHKLRSNQYLIARVYDAEAAMKNKAIVLDTEGKDAEKKDETYFVGQLLVIKGTEVSFYIPPTGIEVIAIDERRGEYVREAVTLERLEYAILKDENGEKRYCHGPAVVFPEPTETFVKAPKGGTIFRALELSPISGIYVKVIAEYEEKGIKHPIGEELFITGKDQMIYYPRPEHAMIQYDGKYMHHAIAIPEGEGRYILNRLTGEIKTVKGPVMYLPDPRTEVVVKRSLSDKECELMYPGNAEVLAYNRGITDEKISKMANKGQLASTDAINTAYATSNQEATLAIFEANANISRGVSYTKPRTITLDTKYDGVVAINVWTGYAVNVVSKSGKREVVIGPATRLLDYDETLEAVTLSTGTPKDTKRVINTAYLRVENNKVSDAITVQTKDFVNVQLNVSFCVNFLEKYKNKWFSVDNYIKLMCDRIRSVVKNEVKKYNIEEFYSDPTSIVRKVVLNLDAEKKEGAEYGRVFHENGMQIYDVEVLGVKVEDTVAKLLYEHQDEMVRKALELSDAEKNMEVTTKLDNYAKETARLQHETALYRMNLDKTLAMEKAQAQAELENTKRAAEAAKVQAEADVQIIYNAIAQEKLNRTRAEKEAEIAHQRELAAIEEEKNKAYAEKMEQIIKAISPDLIAAMTSNANANLMETVAKSMSPYAIAKGESVSEVTNKLLRGTPLEGLLEQFAQKKN